MFYFFEHVASRDERVRKRQDRLNPIWGAMYDGCELDRPTNKWIIESCEWADHKSA